MTSPLTLLIVDDHFVVRSGLVAALEIEDDIEVIGEAKRGDQALEAYERLRPGVVLMDLQLPGLSGVQATAAICAHDPEARILVFSTFSHEDEILAALNAGAAGYVQKSSTREDLLAALRRVAAGGTSLPPELAQRLESQRIRLTVTPREREVLELIASGQANKRIAASMGVAEDTVKRHVTHILEKLGVNDRAQATAEAIRRGIIRV
jgi:DNA-binding NarL/FixJ family response regulator